MPLHMLPPRPHSQSQPLATVFPLVSVTCTSRSVYFPRGASWRSRTSVYWDRAVVSLREQGAGRRAPRCAGAARRLPLLFEYFSSACQARARPAESWGCSAGARVARIVREFESSAHMGAKQTPRAPPPGQKSSTSLHTSVLRDAHGNAWSKVYRQPRTHGRDRTSIVGRSLLRGGGGLQLLAQARRRDGGRLAPPVAPRLPGRGERGGVAAGRRRRRRRRRGARCRCRCGCQHGLDGKGFLIEWQCGGRCRCHCVAGPPWRS